MVKFIKQNNICWNRNTGKYYHIRKNELIKWLRI